MIYHTLSNQDKKEICSWHYEGVYEIYDLPNYYLLKLINGHFFDPKTYDEYIGFYEEDETLIGYVHLGKKEQMIMVGIGVEPNHLALGYGKKILALVDIIKQEKYPEYTLQLLVRVWNRRAVNCYLSSGYKIINDHEELTINGIKDTFYRMERVYD